MPIRAVGFEPVAIYRKPSYDKPGYGFRITNLDEVNPVYFETDNLTITSSASSPLPQQASVTFDGSKDVWMSSGVQGRTVLVDFSPSSLTYDNPVGVQIALNALGLATAAGQVAQETAIPAQMLHSGQGVTTELAALLATGSPAGTPGGVPLLHGFRNLGQSTVTIAAGGSQQVTFTFTAPGYVLSLLPSYSGLSGGTPFLQVEMQWLDAVNMACETWYVPVSASGGFLFTGGKGPVKAGTLKLTFFNMDTGEPVQVDYEVAQTTAHIARDDWRTGFNQNTTTAPGFFNPPGQDASALVLAQDSGLTVGSGATLTYLLPLYCGQARITWQGSGFSAANTFFVTVTPVQVSALGQALVYQSSNPSTSNLTVNADVITMSRRPCLLTFDNTGTGPVTVSFAVQAMEYAS